MGELLYFVRRISYQILLVFLRGLIYAKRLFVFIFHLGARAGAHMSALYRNTIGFRIYKFFFFFKRAAGQWIAPAGGRLIDALLHRHALQWLLVFTASIMMFPESKFFTQDETRIPGHRTLLYLLIGPGDQDYALEEITAETSEVAPKDAPRSWREGVAGVDPGGIIGEESIIIPDQGIAGVSMGGAALTKPTILPGTAFPGSGTTGRTEVVLYEVRQGDVIGAIASQYGVSVATILWANNLTARSYIRPGDALKIPPVTGVIHKVKKGETVGRIAKSYKAKEEDIISFNKLQPGGTDIVIGEELMVPGGAKASPISAPLYRSGAFANLAAPPSSIAAPAGSGYLWPTAVRRITQYYGWRHTGLDIGGPAGTAVYAARAGVVTRSNCGWNGGYGCYIVIDHGNGVATAYGHNAKLFVSAGQEVAQGQTISVMGSTGRSTGPHLHFEVRVNGRRQNPLQYIR